VALTSGSKLGLCEILAPLGAGGMSEVYRARDPRLHLEVAIKVLARAFSRDPARLARCRKDVTPDGRRFLMLRASEQPSPPVTHINVVLNWFEELKRRVPVE
jgi:serine/threonine protein kinase